MFDKVLVGVHDEHVYSKFIINFLLFLFVGVFCLEKFDVL